MTEPVMLRFVVTQDARDLLGVLEEYVDWKRQRIQDMLDWPEEPETEEAETVALAALEVAMSMSNRLANQLAFRGSAVARSGRSACCPGARSQYPPRTPRR